MKATWLVAQEYIRRSFTSRLLVLVGVVVLLYILIASCFFGAQIQANGQFFVGEGQLSLARTVSYHLAVGWGILFAIMLGMSVVSRPLEDGRSALLFARGLKRGEVLLGQLLGAWLTALATVLALALVTTAMHLIRGHIFPVKLWLALAPAVLAPALAAALVTFFSMFLPRVVAGMMGILAYAGSFPAAFPQLREFLTGEKAKILGLPWYVKWGAEAYFAACPPLAGLQFRGAELLATPAKWGQESWFALGTAAVYTALALAATWALYRSRDV